MGPWELSRVRKFLFFLLVLGMIAGGLYLGLRRPSSAAAGSRTSDAAAADSALASLPAAAHEFRFATLGRPAELPILALSRLPELRGLPVRVVPCRSEEERWLLLASGNVDALLASEDELARRWARFCPNARVTPVARQAGNEAVAISKNTGAAPLVGFVPGGLSEALATGLHTPALAACPVPDPDTGARWLKSGQLRACALPQPWLEAARAAGCEIRPSDPGALECWVLAPAPTGGGSRVTGEEQLSVVRAWYGLVDTWKRQPAVGLRAIAEENELTPDQVTAATRGLEFLTGGDLQAHRADLATHLDAALQNKVRAWSLAGIELGGDPSQLHPDLGWVDALGLDGDVPSSSSSPSSSPSSVPMASPDPSVPSPVVTPSAPVSDAFHSDALAVRQAGGDCLRSGRLPGPAVNDEPKELWKATLAAEPTSATVALPDGSALVTGCNGTVQCVASSDGHPLWKFDSGDRVRSAPVCYADEVVAGGDNGQVVALDVKDGSRKWAFAASSDVVGALAGDAASVYATTADGQVVCLDRNTGDPRWNASVTGNVTAGPALSDRTLVVCGQEKEVVGLSADDGTVRWSAAVGDAVRGTPCIESGLVMFGCADHNIYGLRLNDGSVAWKTALPDEAVAAGAAVGQTFCIGCKDNEVYGLDRGTGKISWHYPTRERVATDVVAAGHVVYACSQDMRVYALDGITGKLLWKHKENGWLLAPWVQDGTMYLPVSDGTLRALR